MIIPECLIKLNESVMGDYRGLDYVKELNALAGYEKVPVIKLNGKPYMINSETNRAISVNRNTKAVIDLSGRTVYQAYNNRNRVFYDFDYAVAYVDGNGTVFYEELHVNTGTSYYDNNVFVYGVSVTDWKVATGAILQKTFIIDPENKIYNVLSKSNPYGLKWALDNGMSLLNLYLMPELEQLSKCGYTFAQNILYGDYNSLGSCRASQKETYLRRLIKRGSSPKDIFKAPLELCRLLKDDPDLSKWDINRRMVKKGKITVSQAGDIIRNNFTKRELEQINAILNFKHDGKSVVSFDELVRYIEHVDVFEAIETDEALELIKDYCASCRELGQKPDFSFGGKGLKCRHDKAARDVRNSSNKIYNAGIEGKAKLYAEYNYHETSLFARVIRDYDDLVDEAKQQKNCVAGYARWIKSGRCVIMVVRHVKEPDKSYITVELDPKTGEIRQRYLSHNRPVELRSDLAFLDRLEGYVQKIISGEESIPA